MLQYALPPSDRRSLPSARQKRRVRPVLGRAVDLPSEADEIIYRRDDRDQGGKLDCPDCRSVNQQNDSANSPLVSTVRQDKGVVDGTSARPSPLPVGELRPIRHQSKSIATGYIAKLAAAACEEFEAVCLVQPAPSSRNTVPATCDGAGVIVSVPGFSLSV